LTNSRNVGKLKKHERIKEDRGSMKLNGFQIHNLLKSKEETRKKEIK